MNATALIQAVAEQDSGPDLLRKKLQKEPIKLLIDCFPNSLPFSMYFATGELFPTVTHLYVILIMETAVVLQFLSSELI